jgi:hypothetical protein
MPAPDRVFTCRSARSPSIMAAIGAVLLIETLVLHALLVSRHPVIAWALTIGSVLTLAWLAADFRAMGGGGVRVLADALDIRVGRRVHAVVPRALLASAVAPTWRDIPERSDGYLDATQPAEPNVLLTLREPVPVRLLGVRRPVRLIALHLDEAAGFLSVLAADVSRE